LTVAITSNNDNTEELRHRLSGWGVAHFGDSFL
jgi:hypothetical protein